ncbi:MAG: hypothetical protein ABSF37_05525 [Sedimentisphaerales bacterium]
MKTNPAKEVQLLSDTAKWFAESLEFERPSGVETIKTNVRIIVATNKNLEQQINSNSR